MKTITTIGITAWMATVLISCAQGPQDNRTQNNRLSPTSAQLNTGIETIAADSLPAGQDIKATPYGDLSIVLPGPPKNERFSKGYCANTSVRILDSDGCATNGGSGRVYRCEEGYRCEYQPPLLDDVVWLEITPIAPADLVNYRSGAVSIETTYNAVGCVKDLWYRPVTPPQDSKQP